MRKCSTLFITVLVFAVLFIGCNSSVHRSESDSNSVSVSFGVAQAGRTALADVTFSDYTYTLDAVENYGLEDQKDSAEVFKGRSYAELSGSKVNLTPTTYKFTLYAKQNGKNILAGVAEANLSSGNSSVMFTMYPCAGAKGNAEITIKLPAGDTVASVKAFHSSTPVATLDSVASSSVTDLVITHDSEGDGSTAVYTLTGLNAGEPNFAIIYLLDSHGGVISSFAESLMVIGNLTCKSTVTYTEDDYFVNAVTVTLNKNNERWASSGKKLSLVSASDASLKYQLKDTSGFFTASVAQGQYKVFSDDEDTGIVLDSVDVSSQIDYYTITLSASTGFTLETVSGGTVLYDGTVLILKNEEYKFKTSLKRGYDTSSSFAVKANAKTLSTSVAVLGNEYPLSSITEETTVSVEGANAHVFTINYQTESGCSWKSGYTRPTTFTVTDDIDLPTAVEYKKSGYLLDGWKIVGGDFDGQTIGYIRADTVFENLTIVPVWKTSVYVDTTNKVVYANGISLLIKESSGATVIYLDIDGDGVIDTKDGDTQVTSDGITDFTGYQLMARNVDPDVEIASDFTFTMTGGTIASITGLGSEKANRSILNISGTAKIGSVETDSMGNITSVKGVDLSSIYKEWVIVNGQMSGDYSVVLVTKYDYQKLVPHYVARIDNSSWASFKQFSCYKKGDFAYSKAVISMKEVQNGGEAYTCIRLADPSPIVMPGSDSEGSAEDSIIGDVNEGFTVGDERISIECSVFSISVEDGSFMVPRNTITLNQSDSEKQIESTLTYMAQPNATTYNTSLATDKSYIYMHIMSSGNQITPEMASEFLAGVVFKRNEATPDVKVKVKINLETVPAADISAAKVQYFNGSFYKHSKDVGSNTASTQKTWTEAYKEAKDQVFNGLNGYLMTISSEVENTYIFSKLASTITVKSWFGGSRLVPTDDKWDITGEEYSAKDFGPTAGNIYYWQCGPEAGQMFYTSAIGPTSTAESELTKGDVYKDEDGVLYTLSGMNDLVNAGSTKKFTKVFTKWSNCYLYPSIKVSNGTKEPNSDKNYACSVQFLTTGYWNDQSWNTPDRSAGKTSDSYGAGYIVEFSAYKTRYNEEVANYQSISSTASY